MKLRKISCFTIVLALLAIFSLSGQALAAGGPEPPPPGYVASGPEFWGVVIMKCRPGLNNDTVNIRFKRVVDCNVETEVLIDEGFGLGCPPDAACGWSDFAGRDSGFWQSHALHYQGEKFYKQPGS